MNDFFGKGIGKVEGLFGLQHLLFSVLGLVMVALLVVFLRKSSAGRILSFLRISFVVIVILEVLKIIWNLTLRGESKLDNWIPLYFCSLYIYALGMSAFGKGRIRKMGDCFLFFGGIIGGGAFLLYPSSSLPLFPLVQVLTVHSLIYHSLFLATGLLLVFSGYYTPKMKDFWLYLTFTTVMSLVAWAINFIFRINLMFISDPWEISPLQLIKKVFGILYPAVIIIGQNVGSFFLGYACYKLTKTIGFKEEKKDAQ